MQKGRLSEVNYIKIKDLKEGYIYKILARNASVGVWLPGKKSFLISRNKFKMNFVDYEIHWDSELKGSAKPIKEFCKCPVDYFDDEIIITYLNNLTKE